MEGVAELAVNIWIILLITYIANQGKEILVRVHATPVNYGDLTARNFAYLTSSQFNMPALFYLPARMAFGWNKPKINILGSELAGEVEAVGKAVAKFKPGDKVFAYAGMKMGANAEYVCLLETGTIALKPTNLTYDLIFDILGRSSFPRAKHSLKPNGTLLFSSFKMKPLFQMLWTSITFDKTNEKDTNSS